MNGEKTEKATPKRRRDARKEGQVVKSMEVNAAVIILLVYLGLNVFGSFMADNLKLLVTDFLSGQYLLQSENFMVNFRSLYIIMLKHFLIIIGPLLLIAFLAALVINYLQIGFLFLPKLLTMKFDKINPINGIKRIFSLRSAVEILKSIIKLVIVGYVVYFEFQSNFTKITNLIYTDVGEGAAFIWSIIMAILWKAGLTFLVFGVFDYAFQRWEYEKKLRMSKEEVKQEYKLMEGDPQIKARIREVQRHMAMQRMMQKVAEADVVITNPTHFAVALKYEENKNNAPLLVAKGQDYIALKIKEEAKKHNVYIVENKPLAQTLYKTTDIGEEIPEDLYQAVAEILAVVYRMRRK